MRLSKLRLRIAGQDMMVALTSSRFPLISPVKNVIVGSRFCWGGTSRVEGEDTVDAAEVELQLYRSRNSRPKWRVSTNQQRLATNSQADHIAHARLL